MRLTMLAFWLLATSTALALEPIPDKLVVLTFDDSSKSHIEVAAPLLKKHGFGATFFITEGFDFPKNKRDYMTWDEIAQLHKMGFEIGNHTRDHKAPSAKDKADTVTQFEAINAQCQKHGIPRPISFSYPGNALDRDVLPILKELGIKFARRGGAPEYPYEKGQGFAFEPGLDHPLLIPSAGDGRPVWTLDNFKQAVAQARGGKIAVIQLHGVPDTAHSWVNTPRPLFESYIKYLADNGFKVIAMRDLARYVDPNLAPTNPWGVIEDRKKMLATGTLIDNARSAKTEGETRLWLERMKTHEYTPAEAGAALGLTEAAINQTLKRLDPKPIARPTDGSLLILPYPGGRHPRVGFLDGAIRPQRETKISVFAPWKEGGYAVADVPEAVWHNPSEKVRKLLYLAHTHVPTLWDEKGVTLPALEWTESGKNTYEITRVFPNKVAMTSKAWPDKGGVRFEFSVRNGSNEVVSGMDVQMCVMLKSLKGFEAQTKENKVIAPPFAAAHDASGRRWIITGWDLCNRAWGNAPCPCLHSDPRLPDCSPGATQTAKGWISFYEGTDIQAELKRIQKVAFSD